jgi:integrase
MFDSGKYSYGTMELTAITMHAIFKCAVENNYISKNPANNLKIKKRDIDLIERRVLTREEQKIFKEYAKNTLYYNAYCLVLETGLRAGEVGGLKWDDIDFDNHYLYVNRTLLQDKQKGGFFFGTPKSRLSKRKIPLTDEAIKVLNDQKQVQNRLKFQNDKWVSKWNGLVFTTINGNPVGTSTFRTMMVRIVANINKDRMINSVDGQYEEFEHCYMHSLRHTFATRCIEKGVQPKSLQKMLGHSTIQVTMDLYVHVTDEQLSDEIEKMNKAI